MGTSHRAVQLSGPRSSIISEKSSSSTTTMGKGNNEGGFSQEQIDMYKECFKLMDVDKDGTLAKMTCVPLSTTLVNSWMNLNWTPCWEKLVAHAHSTPWSKCSKRRWLVELMILMTSLSAHLRLMRWSRKRMARKPLKPKCSDML